ncbi:FadR/GntR family transcriptional regulator [Biformimicrobium ophioploci]|uniref:FadR/GntR family transcriptional regulator n=1 Tax=Biformimicrobium ophioploci TaxID=3036711 RepID=A0ABQ6LVQ9_9GAMM|nr:FCD domain-containing protein [Microbulbifer sp. NKW57]GMG86150.1 FadR/GntR family transcriptional regulator [Microbulbifer sp. NKW57]
MSKAAGRNLTHQLAHDLGNAILQGRFMNVPFPSEAELSEQFSVSRSATREAVKMLTAKGILSSRPRQGIRIMPESDWNLFDTDVLDWILSSKPGLEVLRDFVQMRAAIEPEAAALAAARSESEDVADIGRALERMQAAELGQDDPLESDIAFHGAILRASGNRFFIQLQPFSATALRVSIRHTNRFKGVNTADTSAHARVYSAIKRGKVQQARKLMHGLIDEALQLIEDAMPASGR